MSPIRIPSAYIEDYAKARLHDQAVTDNYMRHTTIGDPELDPVLEELSALPPADLHKFVKAGVEQESDVLRMAPKVLRDFFDKVDAYVPP